MGARSIEKSLPDTYLELIRNFPLKHIKDQKHLKQAQAVLDELIQRDLDEGSEDYLDALTDLVGVYENENEPIPDAVPADVLRELVHSSGLSQQRLAQAVGIAQSTISAVMTGQRKLTTDQLVKLAEYFKVSPSVFLPR